MEYSQQFPFQLCPTAAESSIPHGLCEGDPVPELTEAAGNLARSMGFVSHQLLLILGVSISSHPRTFHRRPVMSLNYSHTPGYLWIIFTLKEREKIQVWITVMPLASEEPFLQGSLIWMAWAEHQPLQSPISLHSKGSTRLYGGNFQISRRL